MIRLFFFLIIFLLCFSSSVFTEESVTSEILLLNNRFYSRKMMKLIRGAEESIYVCMNTMHYKPGSKEISTRLVEELAKQAGRGIHVEVILESGSVDEIKPENKAARQFFLDRGVLFIDDQFDKITRVNMVIVDDFTCVLGSTIWTDQSIYENNELELWIESKEFAQVLKNRFMDLKIYGKKPYETSKIS